VEGRGMLYKKLFPGRKLRLRLLKAFDFLPDFIMVSFQYFISTGRFLNLSKATRFTEKLQWYKLYYRDDLMTACSDKYEVREYVESKGFSDILIPLYGVYESVDDILFNEFPDKFVLKTTNGSHTNILCENKRDLDIGSSKFKLDAWLKDWAGKVGREWSYYNIEPKIICEQYIEKDKNDDLVDYKFFCFNGEPYCLYVIIDRFLEGGLKLGIYDMEFKKLPYRRNDIPSFNTDIKKPDNFDLMLEIARKLSKDFPHVRVDLYNINGKIYFGELTFYDGSGYKGYLADEFDYMLGNQFKLPAKKIG